MYELGPVVPIPPPFQSSGEINFLLLREYLAWLSANGVKSIMTTAGTSQFNLLSQDEIRSFNKVCSEFSGYVILGLPPLNTKSLLQEIEWYNKLDSENIILMALYPDRYYADEHIIKYFYNAADFSKFPVFIHGMFMRRGAGGMYDYEKSLVSRLASHKNIVGMKEECSNFELGYTLCKNIPQNFIKVVAGKSARRFSLLKHAYAQSYLAGLGNLFPRLELDLFNSAQSSSAHFEIFLKYEDLLFETFMKIGWHKALRCGLGYMYGGFSHCRNPFPYCSQEEKEQIRKVINIIELRKLG